MSVIDLTALGEELLARARSASSGRANAIVHGAEGGVLSQVVLALVSGRTLSDHENPGEALLQVLSGRVRLTAGEESWELGPGELTVVPQCRHGLEALADALVLLTVATHPAGS